MKTSYSVVYLVVMLAATLVGKATFAQVPDSPCNFEYSGKCYRDLSDAEVVMHGYGGGWSYALLERYNEDDSYVHYYLKPTPALPPISWRGSYYIDQNWPVFGPALATYEEALDFTVSNAAKPSKKFPTKIASNNLVYRGETNDGGLIQRYFSHDYPSVPISQIDVTDSDLGHYLYCSQYTPGVAEARITKKYHNGYASDELAPWNAEPGIVWVGTNNCYMGGGVWWRIFRFDIFQVKQQTSGALCNPNYTYSGGMCVGTLFTQIKKNPSYVLEPPTESPTCEKNNESNPCNPADGSKTQAEADFASAAAGALAFTRYYSSQGAYRTALAMGRGWRHTYSRHLDEQPDRGSLVNFAAAVNRSNPYSLASDACTAGWDDIKATVYGGSLASGTAAFSGGNTCAISVAGAVRAYMEVRATVGRTAFTAASTVKTITRPDGTSIRFTQVGSDWVSELDGSLSLVKVGSDWEFTDRNDVRETYNSGGQLTAITQRNGQTDTLAYNLTAAQGGDDDSSTLDRVIGPFGHAIYFVYNGSGLLESVITPDGAIGYSYDMDGNLTGVSYPDSTQRHYLYEDFTLPSYLTGLIDEKGERFATWQYDNSGRAILSEHANGQERVQFSYNGDGTTTVTTASGASRTYVFGLEQGRRQVTSIAGDVCSTCPGGDTQSRTFDSNGYVAQATDWNGNVTETARNGRGLTETLTEAAGSADERVTTTVWHASYRLPTQITSPKNVTAFVYDALGNPTTLDITDGIKSREWGFGYNASGQVLSVDGPRTDVADITAIEYYNCTSGDECGQRKSVTNALGQITSYDAYDASGRLLQMTDPNALVTAFTYDQRGNVLTITQTPSVGSARVTTMTYDPAGQLASMAMPDGQTLAYAYTAAHYLESVTDNLGNRIEYAYDAMGNRQAESTYDPGSVLKRAVGYAYDLNNRLNSVTRGGFATALSFDLVGNLTGEVDPALAQTQHGYDALNRLKQTVDALNGVVQYGYDATDNLISVAAANGATTTFAYDNLDNLVQEISPDRGNTTYTHDAAGNVISATDARGKVTTYTYDALNRVTLIELDNSDSIALEYDTGANAIGRLSKITDTSGQTTWGYDNFGMVTAKTQTIGSVSLSTSYGYDSAGRLSSVTLPSGKVISYGYQDHLAQSVSVDGTTILSGASYDPFGPVTGWTWGNSTSHSRSFDQRGLLQSQSLVTDTRTLGYDAAGRLVNLDDTRHDLGFAYNALGQVTQASASGMAPLPASQSFSYDGNGNRQSLTENGNGYTYSYASSTNRLTGTTGPIAKTLTYDAAGNVTHDGLHAYAYDDRGRLVSVDAGAVTYTHNGQGQRVRKDAGTTTLFAYGEAGELIGEYDGTGTPIQETVYFQGTPVAVLVGANKYYVHTDQLGTPRAISDGNTVIWRWESDPFGTTAAQEDPDGDLTSFTYNLRFPGQYYDSETGLHYNYFRDYDPAVGRYVESDPIALGGGLNTYGYVRGNPLSYIDPAGLFLSSGHLIISANALRDIGLSNQFVQDAVAASIGLDFVSGSQAPKSSNIHSMSMPNEPAADAARRAAEFIETQLARCDATGLGYALHTAQDSAAGGHRFKKYRGLSDIFINDPMHFIQDSWPYGDVYQEALVKSQNVIRRFKQKCSCHSDEAG